MRRIDRYVARRPLTWTMFVCTAKPSWMCATSPSRTVMPFSTFSGIVLNSAMFGGDEFMQHVVVVPPMRACPAGRITLLFASAATTSCGRHAARLHLARREIHHHLPAAPAVRRGRRQARDREQAQPQEVQAVVEQLLLAQAVALDRELRDLNVGGVVLEDGWRREPRRHDAQGRVADGVDLRDGRADVSAFFEVDADQADAEQRLRLDARDAADRRREGALGDEHDPLLHVVRRQARVVPDDD